MIVSANVAVCLIILLVIPMFIVFTYAEDKYNIVVQGRCHQFSWSGFNLTTFNTALTNVL